MHVDKIKVLQEISRLSARVPEISLHEEFILKLAITLSERMTPVYQIKLISWDIWEEASETQYANALLHPNEWQTRILWTK